MADFTDMLFLPELAQPLAQQRPDDITAYMDVVAPLVVFTPGGGTVAPTDAIQVQASDERVLAILTIAQDDRIVFDGSNFTSGYTASADTPWSSGKRLTLRRNAGWPGSFTLTALALDKGGNVVTLSAVYGSPLVATDVAASVRRQQRGAISDVHLFHTPDGGEIAFEAGQALLSDGLESALYLSLFGGNERDSGRASDERFQWWGNLGELELAKQYRSETQHLVRSLPATTGNLRRVEDAVHHDLAWLTGTKLARSTKVAVTMPKLNTIAIAVNVELATGESHRFEFRQPWGART